MAMTAAILGAFAVAGTTLVALTEEDTKVLIAQNERASLQRKLNEVVPRAAYDNDITADTTLAASKPLLGSPKPLTVYRARMEGRPVAAVLETVAPDGYTGAIRLLVAVRYDDESLLGVRVIEHRETPGLGDWIDSERSDWISHFAGHSLSDPDDLGWRVEKDGGIFDQFTGATITPRAVVKAVHNSLKYFQTHKDELFRTTEAATGAPQEGIEHGTE
ncbi:MAG: electron transport complex subunit RsxG [Gammaproteobacteria bacterium]|nr:electron transport complex subunit RsxG [Gammaproteobacteria bacterium]